MIENLEELIKKAIKNTPLKYCYWYVKKRLNKTNHKIVKRKDRSVGYLEKGMVDSAYKCPMPSFYFVDVCNICNLRCRFCPTGNLDTKLSMGRMALENYTTIFNKISPYAKEIHLYNYGESFLNKDIVPIISMTSARGIYTEIHSNLTWKDLSDQEAENIAGSGLSLLSVSCDGASQETYGKYRIGGSFDRVIRNIQQILKAKKRLKSNMQVRWNFLINGFNEHEQEMAAKMANKLDISLNFSLMMIGGLKEWESSFHKNNNRSDDPYKGIEPADKFIDRSLPKQIKDIELYPNLPNWCMQPFTRMTINSNGDVFPCCAVHDDCFTLGNLLCDELDAIWNGDNIRRCREFLFNYGSLQNTGSVCELWPCSVRDKYVKDN